jgi:hypothetical protein
MKEVGTPQIHRLFLATKVHKGAQRRVETQDPVSLLLFTAYNVDKS